MRLAVVFLSGGGMSGGARTTFREQIPRLHKHAAVEALRVYVPPAVHAQLAPALGDELALETWSKHDAYLGYPRLRRTIQSFRPDVCFIPTASHLALGTLPVVTMVRNTEPFARAGDTQHWLHAWRNRLRWARTRDACTRATRIVAVSNYVQELIQTHFGIPPERIDVIPHGVTLAATMTRPDGLRSVGERKFFFTAGSLLPYRGIEDAILAMRHERLATTRLVIAGSSEQRDGYERMLRRLIDQEGVADRIIFLGQRSPAELAWCYAHCLAFVMTSRTEACPNVVLEALAAGCISIATSAKPMPEFFGPSAQYYSPGDAAELARQLVVACSLSRAERQARSQEARARGEGYSWMSNLAATIRTLQTAMGEKGQDLRREAA